MDKKTNIEYIWHGDPKHWGRHAPVLFPIVGKLLNDEYRYNDMSYNMSQHGFARDLDFLVHRHEANYAALSLKSSPLTRMQYPFSFELIIGYELNEKSLEVTYRVINHDREDMYFSIGGHPAFNCPIGDDRRSDYNLIFEQVENATTQLLESGLRIDEERPLLNQTNCLNISDDLFDLDALIFQDLKSKYVSLARDNDKLLTFHFEGFPYLGIWSKSRVSPFVCIEPWFGIADRFNTNQKLQEKEGIIILQSKEQFECSYLIEIH